MNDRRFNALLIAARPQHTKVNRVFTDAVMSSIHSSEIFSSHIRNMDITKKETFMLRLRHLPKLAIVAIALGIVIALSGTAYAAYQLLWAQPKVELNETTTSVSGREEVILSMSECGHTQTSHYELKKGATITADRIAAVVQAQCELQAINDWAQSTYGNYRTTPLTNDKPYQDSTMAMVSMATHLQKKSDDSVTFTAIKKYGYPQTTLDTNSEVKYIVDGKEAAQSAIKEGDVVAYVTKYTVRMTLGKDGSYSGGGQPQHTLVAIVKLSMPFEDYDQFAWQSLSERESCYGNPDDSCVSGGASIDLYMGGGGALSETVIMKEIQGVVTALNGTTTSIRSSSGTIFNITTPTDVITSYNQEKAAQYYNNQKVVIGSSILVRYVEDKNKHSHTIQALKCVSRLN